MIYQKALPIVKELFSSTHTAIKYLDFRTSLDYTLLTMNTECEEKRREDNGLEVQLIPKIRHNDLC